VTAPVVPDAGQDPAGYVLAAADLREKRAKAVAPGPWLLTDPNEGSGVGPLWTVVNDAFLNPPADENAPWLAVELHTGTKDEAEYVAAEANPKHALAEVALWRGVVERHELAMDGQDIRCCRTCLSTEWPCPDLLDVVAAARAYLTGAGG
jgi:hypothetical protein